MVTCPYCQGQHDEANGRICDACGLYIAGLQRPVPAVEPGATSSEQPPPRPKKLDDDEERPLIACRHCGARGRPPRCPDCGRTIRQLDESGEEIEAESEEI